MLEGPGPMSETTYLTPEEAAQLAHCSTKTIRRAIASGRLRAFRPTTRLLLAESDVRAWVESPAPEPKPRRRQGRRRVQPGSVAALRQIERELT